MQTQAIRSYLTSILHGHDDSARGGKKNKKERKRERGGATTIKDLTRMEFGEIDESLTSNSVIM